VPASDQTAYPMKLLHRLFALACLALLATTVWLLVQDHQRQWKQYQRTANRIDSRVASWRKRQYETDEAVRQRQQLQRQLEQARDQQLDSRLLAQFRAQVVCDAQRRGTSDELAGFDQACRRLEAFCRGQAGQTDGAGGPAAGLRAAVLAQLRTLIAAARLREDERANAQRLRTADWDVAKADVGLAVRAGRPAEEVGRRQIAADRLRAEVAELARRHAAAKEHRLALDATFAQLTVRERELEQKLADSRADLERLEAAAVNRESEYFHLRRGFPRPGKRFLELPILDAFNSPLRIENLWAEGLTQDFNFRHVPRFDRCTTCHTAMQKTQPGSADAPAYPREQLLQFALQIPVSEAASARSTATQRGALGADSTNAEIFSLPQAVDPALPQRLEDIFGLRLAGEGLLDPNDATVCYIRPGTPAAQAALVPAPPVAQTADQILLDLFQTGDATPTLRGEPGLQAGDVIVAINGQSVAGCRQAIAQLAVAVASAVGERAASVGSAGPPRGDDAEAAEANDDESPARGAASPSVALTVRRGLPHPFSSHPRLDLFVGDHSPHKLSDFACTICHEGQGSATDFRWASHSPDDLADRQRWRGQYGWFDNPCWDEPMIPRRFLESACLKCHHRVADLRPSERFPDPPAPKLLRGDTLIRTYGCYGCHEINGYQAGRSVGPDLRTEPPETAAGRETVGHRPGQLRQPGPSLRYVGRKLDDAFLFDWLSDPQRYRPTTLMPRVFGLWDHLSGNSRQLAQQYEPLEILGIVAYLRDCTQDPGPAATPAGITDSPAADKAERGRVLFQTRGCLACHAHAAFADADKFRAADEIVAGPDLSEMAGKLTGEARRAWLTEFLRQPTRQLPRTIMPDLLLEPIQHRDAAGQVVSVTDPAEDLAEFLLQPAASAYQPQPSPEIDVQTLDQLTLEYLRGAFHDSKARQYVEQRIPFPRKDTLREAEKELVVAQEANGSDVRQAAGGGRKTKLSVQQKLRYVGVKSLTKYGCFGCHDISGLETAKQIGPALSDWGRKDTSQLAFENIMAYLQTRLSPQAGQADEPAAAPARQAGSAASDSGDPATVAYFRQQLAVGSRIGFLFQKLTEPRSYDYQVAPNKAYNDRLRMPQFPFDADEREAIITFVLGLVARAPAEKYIHAPDSRRAAVVEGQILLDKYRCSSCHLLEPQKWRLEYASGEFPPQPDKAVFPFVHNEFGKEELQRSQQPDARDLLHATLVGMPTLGDDGRPLIFDEEGDELFEDETYLSATLEYPFQLWRPVALDGHGYQVGGAALNVWGDQIAARRPAWGGFLTQYLLTPAARLEKSVNPNAKGSEVWGWLPPPLLGEGAKVRPEWLHDYLLAPYPIRPASLMRMPKYTLSAGESAALVDYFAAQDRVDYPYHTVNRRDRAYLQQADRAYREQQRAQPEPANPALDRLDAAMRIVTDKNFCVTCHIVGDYDPRTSERAKGPNLADVYQRLRPDYVRRWVAEPVSILPYTGMPVIIAYRSDAPHQGGVDQSLYPGTSTQQLDALVDLLMNFDVYTRWRAPVRPLIEAAPAP